MEQLSLEILRYFDYFQSQWRHPSPTRVYICVKKGNVDEIKKSLSSNLSMEVEPYSFENTVIGATNTASKIDKCILEIGCALRERNAIDAPND